MTWVVLVLWLVGDERLPTTTGTLLQARETFPSEAACVAAIPHFQEVVLHDFGAPGVIACTPQRGPDVAAK